MALIPKPKKKLVSVATGPATFPRSTPTRATAVKKSKSVRASTKQGARPDFTLQEVIELVGDKEIGESTYRRMVAEAQTPEDLKSLRDTLSTWRTERRIELIAMTLPEGHVTDKLLAEAVTKMNAAIADNAWVILIGRPALKG